MISIHFVDYIAHQHTLHQIRHEVFVEEQGIPPSFEVDRWDPISCHVLATWENQPIGTGRLLPNGYIGRVAVRQPMRQRGIGTQILHILFKAASQQGHTQVELAAQCHAISFYHRLGFREVGNRYRQVGIDHIRMIKVLPTVRSWGSALIA